MRFEGVLANSCTGKIHPHRKSHLCVRAVTGWVHKGSMGERRGMKVGGSRSGLHARPTPYPPSLQDLQTCHMHPYLRLDAVVPRTARTSPQRTGFPLLLLPPGCRLTPSSSRASSQPTRPGQGARSRRRVYCVCLPVMTGWSVCVVRVSVALGRSEGGFSFKIASSCFSVARMLLLRLTITMTVFVQSVPHNHRQDPASRHKNHASAAGPLLPLVCPSCISLLLALSSRLPFPLLSTGTPTTASSPTTMTAEVSHHPPKPFHPFSLSPLPCPPCPGTFSFLSNPSLSMPPLLPPSPRQAAYSSPVDPALFGLLSLILIGSGLSFMAMFFVYEMKVSDRREGEGSEGRSRGEGRERGLDDDEGLQ